MNKRDEVSDTDIREAWDTSINASEVSSKLGVSRKTGCKWLRSVGIEPTRDKYNRLHRKDYGKMATWLRQNPSTPLPRSIKTMAEIIGASPSAIRSYLSRRQASELQKKHLEVVKMIKANELLTDVEGKKFHTKAIKDVKISIDPFTTKATITINLKTGTSRRL